jgi:deazaflavin-dependent oxidoreductase (nitroreductase family)
MAATTRLAFLRPFTTHVLNPILRPVAGWLPGFGVLTYLGRKSGRRYRTSINVFRRGDEYVFALTYGSEVQWVKNVIAAGGCEIHVRCHDVRLVEPEVFVDPTRHLMPPVVRLVLSLGGVTEFLRMRADRPATTP